jgi:hypothetical protein
MMKCRDLLYIAFREAHILKRPQAVNSDNELKDGLIFLNQLVNYWAARDCYAYTTTFTVYTLRALHQPHLIGPNLTAPDFAAPIRPVDIKSAAIILTGPMPVDVPVKIRDNAWWANTRAKTVTSSVPADLYYEPDYPNGALWFWPVPSFAYGLRLETTVQLHEFLTLDDPFLAPQAYQAAVALSLAEELCDLWEVPTPANLPRRALKARDALQSNNNLPPRIASADYGTFSSPAGDFNYVTGTLPE